MKRSGVVQGRCISYQPDWQPFPLLEVRADVVVVGPVPLMAIVKLARLVVKDAADMAAQGHYIQALVLQVCISTATAVFFEPIVSNLITVTLPMPALWRLSLAFTTGFSHASAYCPCLGSGISLAAASAHHSSHMSAVICPAFDTSKVTD